MLLIPARHRRFYYCLCATRRRRLGLPRRRPLRLSEGDQDGRPDLLVWAGDAKEAWYQLPKDEQDKLMARVVDTLPRAGGKGVLACDADWSSRPWLFFGVEEYPDIEAVRRHAKLLQELNWYRYADTMMVLGTRWEGFEVQAPTEAAPGKLIYKFWLARSTEAWNQLSKDEQDKLFARNAEAQQAGSKTLVLCDSAWSSEQWPACGVEEYLDIDSVQRHAKLLQELNWGRYFESLTMLGTRSED